MNAILSFETQQTIKPVSINNKSRYEQLIKEVESLEIDKLLGSAFYQDICKNPVNYTDLLNGCSFVDCHGNTVEHLGLNFVIAYLVFAAYVRESYMTDTFTGFVKKTRPDSELLNIGDLKNLETKNREIAFNAFELIKKYLDLNSKTYTFWNCNSNKIVNNFKMYGIKNTRR